MFGCPSYQANGILSAFLAGKGVVIIRLDDANRTRLSTELHAAQFQVGHRTVRACLEVPVAHGEEVERVLPFVRKSYEGALKVGCDAASPSTRASRGHLESAYGTIGGEGGM